VEYFQKVEEYEIPCEGMYLSSGYIKAENGVAIHFLWNTAKIPRSQRIYSIYKRAWLPTLL